MLCTRHKIGRFSLFHLKERRQISQRTTICIDCIYISDHSDAAAEACIARTIEGSKKHRHHGSWYHNRQMAMTSPLLIAAVKSGKISVPPVWRDGVLRTLAGLRYWGVEAPDAEEVRLILESMLGELSSPDDVCITSDL